MTQHRTPAELEAFLTSARAAPAQSGTVELVVARPGEGKREVLAEGRLTLADGLGGDSWKERRHWRAPDRSPNPDRQLTIMGARVASFVAVTPERVALAGDQLYVDLDLCHANLPTGTQLSVGSAVIEVTAPPHRGCAKFVKRFGEAAMALVNSAEGRDVRLRGLNARVVIEGVVRSGDKIVKL